MMKFSALIALTFCSVVSTGSVGPIETCQIQSNYAKFSIDKILSTSSGVPDCPGNCAYQYRICLTLRGLDPSKSLSHTCVKPPDACPVGDFYLYNATWGQRGSTYGLASGPNSPAANDLSQCQWVQAGAYAYFLLKDGNSCQPPNNTDIPDYSVLKIPTTDPSGTSVNVTAECRSRLGWEYTGQYIRSCSGNKPQMECVWKVQAPTSADCGDTPVVPYDIDCDQCAPLTQECRDEASWFSSNGYMSLDIANCQQPDALVSLLTEYGCEKSKRANCNVIYCNSFVPSSVLADYDTMQCPMLR